MTTRELINLLERIESHHGGELRVRLDYAHTYMMDFKESVEKDSHLFIQTDGNGPVVKFYINLP